MRQVEGTSRFLQHQLMRGCFAPGHGLAAEKGNIQMHLGIAMFKLGESGQAWDRGIALMQQCIAYEREMEHGELQQHLALLGEMMQQRLRATSLDLPNHQCRELTHRIICDTICHRK